MKKTWGQLKSECINLGFEKTTAYQKNPSIFIESANRALILISTTVRPILGKYVVTHNPIPNILPSPLYLLNIHQYPGTPIQFTAQGAKSYYFECDGNGTATVSNGVDSEVITLSSNREFKAYRGFMGGTVTITFSGAFAYNIRNIAMYAMTRSASLDDIPAYSQYVSYDISELTKVDGKSMFLDFAEDKPIQRGNFVDGNSYKIVSDYKKQERKILLLNYFDIGQFEVWYKKCPTPIAASTPDSFEIELDYDVAALAPYLMAHDVWLDDDDRKATIYYNKYDDLKNQIMGNQNIDSSVAEFKNSTGWWE